MEQEIVVALGISAGTTLVGWVLFMYLRGVRAKLRKHVLRSDEVKLYGKQP